MNFKPHWGDQLFLNPNCRGDFLTLHHLEEFPAGGEWPHHNLPRYLFHSFHASDVLFFRFGCWFEVWRVDSQGMFLKKLPLTGLHCIIEKRGGFKQFLLCNQLPSWEGFVHIPFPTNQGTLARRWIFPLSLPFRWDMFPLVPWRVIGIPTKNHMSMVFNRPDLQPSHKKKIPQTPQRGFRPHSAKMHLKVQHTIARKPEILGSLFWDIQS